MHPEQVTPNMVTVAAEIIGHSEIAAEAVAAGIADGMFAREEASRGH